MERKPAERSESGRQDQLGEGTFEVLRAGRPGLDLERALPYEQQAAVLFERYAGFVDAKDLTPQERVLTLISLVESSFFVVEEARDTIERLNVENEMLRQGEDIEDADVEE